ncbi:MAG: hypothetical protein HXS53_13090, partial [Theionarchaea archaeon]|nr:hypothetical protein [Theionarchaea archaeon]
IISYVLGCQVTLPSMRTGYFVLTGVVVAFFSFQEYGLIGMIIPVIGLLALRLIEKIQAQWLFLTGVLLLTVQLIIGGIPLFDTILRKVSVTPLFVFGYCFLFVGITFMIRTLNLGYMILAILTSLILLSAFTFRVYILELMIAIFLTLYLYKKVRMIHICMSAVPLLLLIIIIGYVGVLYQDWKLNPLELFMYRPAFTFGVLNKIVGVAGISGISHGRIWLHFASATFIGSHLFGCDCNITSTIMGPLIFDGGLLELGLCMAFFGSASQTLYKKAEKDPNTVPYYAILMAMILVGVDVSFIPSIIVLFLVGLYLSSDDPIASQSFLKKTAAFFHRSS